MKPLAVALALAVPAPAEACRLALALGLDVSASVDVGEYRLQSAGLAAAMVSPLVSAAILADPAAPVVLAVYEWSGPSEQRLVLDWAPMTDRAALEAAAATIITHGRSKFLGKTAIGSALGFADTLFSRAPACAARTLDISGDGKNNEGVEPGEVYAAGQLAGVVVNALAVGLEIPIDMPGDPTVEDHLNIYFEKEVMKGPGAFVESTVDYDGYREAMTRKLLREVGGMQLSEAR